MSNFVVLRLERIKTRGELVGRSRHNLRKGRIPDHIDKSKVALNQAMGDAVKEFDKITKGKKMRKNGVLAVEALLSFSPEMAGKIDPLEWSAASLDWAEKEFGKDNLLEMDLHLDEKTPHMHIIFLPRDKKGKWNWRGLCPGRAGLRDLQTRYADAMKPFGLRRGEPKIGRDHVPPAVQRELERLKGELEKTKEEGKKKVMDREKGILAMVKAYFGEEKYGAFLQWAKDRAKKAKKAETLEKGLLDPKASEAPQQPGF